MQVLDKKKRLKILKTAAKLFAARPFHKVRLSDVAQKAGVGKGTVYTYFQSKDELYLTVFYTGFYQLVEQLEDCMEKSRLNPKENLKVAIGEMVRFASKHPHLFEVMRRKGTGYTKAQHAKRDEKRDRLKNILQHIIEQGNSLGMFDNAEPEIIAWIILGMVRAAVHEAPHKMSEEQLTDHLLDLILGALKYHEKSGSRK